MHIKITDSELEVMRILWQEKRALSFAEIRKALESQTQWSASTIKTLVTRLREKGAISTYNHHVNLYNPNITQAEYVKSQEQSFINKLFDGSAKKLVASLWQSGQLDDKDISELKSLLEPINKEQ